MRYDNDKHPMFEPVRKALVERGAGGAADGLSLAVVEALRDHFALYTEHEEPAVPTREPGSGVTEQFSHVAMEAVKKELLARDKDAKVLHVTLVVTAEDEKVAIASTEHEPMWMLEALQTGYMSARRLVRDMGSGA